MVLFGLSLVEDPGSVVGLLSLVLRSADGAMPRFFGPAGDIHGDGRTITWNGAPAVGRSVPSKLVGTSPCRIIGS